MLYLTQRLEIPAAATASVTLPIDVRVKSRVKVTLNDGREAGLLLPRGLLLRGGDVLSNEEGTEFVQVIAADEGVSVVRCDDPFMLAKACYHLGNRHVPLQIMPGELRYHHDHVLDDMLRQFGLTVTFGQLPFEPEVGAYAARATVIIMLIMTTTLTATSMSTAEQRLRLMQLASSNLPVGGYSWSQGLEWAVEAGWVPDVAAFERWQRRQMTEGFFTVDLPLFARLYRACEQRYRCGPGWTPICWPAGKLVNCGRKSATGRGVCPSAERLAAGLSAAVALPVQQSQLAGMAWLGVRWRIALPEMASAWAIAGLRAP
ncbi:urease accessory protein UreE [Klebsiella pneumoniae]|uniref:Urease accessory protein UreE n=7 Tax=Enterobacterales TaxID=91347 RepID=A0A378BNC8_KLEPN|nr:urease accessory protein UreE [Klebsiella pneumoniae]